jgi:hypothetical protein
MAHAWRENMKLRPVRKLTAAFGALLLLGAGCDSGDASRSGTLKAPPGAPVTTSISADRQRELAALQAQLNAVKNLDAAGFAAKYAVPFSTTLGYDPLASQSLDRITASSFVLQPNEQAALAAAGFVNMQSFDADRDLCMVGGAGRRFFLAWR